MSTSSRAGVTGEFVDLEARVKSGLEHEQRLRQILARANTIEELLRLESELSRVRADIEYLTGRLNVLKDQVEYSTINLSLVEPVQPGEPEKTKLTVWERSVRALRGATSVIIEFTGTLVVFLVGMIPVAIYLGIIGAIGWLGYRALKRFRGPGTGA